MLFHHMNACGSDKANGWHNYTKIYETFVNSNEPVALLEIQESNPQHLHACQDLQGSIKAWKKYFPGNSFIVGRKFEELVFNDDVLFDLIIDDSGFSWKERLDTLKTCWKHIRPNGYYIFEDILSNETFLAHCDLYGLHQTYKFQKCHVYEIPNTNNKYDNNLIVLQKSNVTDALDNFTQPE